MTNRRSWKISIPLKPGNGWNRSTRCCRPQGPERAHFLLERLIDYTRRSGAYLPFRPNTAYVNTIAARPRARVSRATARSSGASRPTSAGMRMAMVVQANRKSTEYGGTSRQLRLLGDALRSGLQSLLARAVSDSIPGDLVYIQGHSSPGHLRARLSRRAPERGAAAPLPPGGRRPGRPVVLSASLADAGLLAVPDRVDGPGADDGDLPGALHPLPGAPRPGDAFGSQGLGVPAATARWTSRSRWARSPCRCARSSTI